MDECPYWRDGSCSCRWKWAFWGKRFEEWEQGDWPTREEWEMAKRDQYFMFECMAHHCPDRWFRENAKQQLEERIYLEAKREDVEMVARARRARLEVIEGET
jgi:hypothetical protein